MSRDSELDNIHLSLIKVLHVLVTERSVSRAALKLHSSQPQVSAQLARLRRLTGDELLVRAGNAMVPTPRAQQLAEPAARILQDAMRMFGPVQRASRFDPATAQQTLRIAISDYLDPLFIPELVARVKREAPNLKLDLVGLSDNFDYRQALAAGDVDLVVGNWQSPPAELHMAPLLSEDIVCLMSDRHPARRAALSGRWSRAQYLASDHVAPMPFHMGARGFVDEHLETLGLRRSISVRTAQFSLIPLMVARSLLVLTSGRQFCQRYLSTLPLIIVPCPVDFPTLTYYQLWHELSHKAPAMRWLRERVRDVVAQLHETSQPETKETK
ncbi:LysR family transcriptional regulator [Ottowia sp.]|jgi:DNA-binding transcriptional LysR family regulator|uniref:LysR family transcriptional regulator n=1 Tax=Ottowia sp. TaxID=1898956 RepID=UPI002C6E9E98|nr:LysR family transcriptional regulator [Ottowia sp.]HRN74274.1 LysR family transcriptional regulator [Ottowia sp.]HRQ01366.1 LysR family transcriptional regulator [Ottowia sp.]